MKLMLLLLFLYAVTLYSLDFVCEKKKSILLSEHRIKTLSNIIEYNDIIYIFDFSSSQLNLFDKEYNYIKKIGGIGQGPGELPQYCESQLIWNDSLIVFSSTENSLSFFDLDGNFIKKKTIRRKSTSEIFSSNIRLYFFNNELDLKNNFFHEKILEVTSIPEYENQINNRNIYSNDVPFKKNRPFYYNTLLLNSNENQFFIGKLNPDKYEILVTSKENGEVKKISKKFLQIRINKNEEKFFNHILSFSGKKPSYYNVYIDKKYIYVNKSVIRDKNNGIKFYLDVFKDCDYIGEITLDFMQSFCEEISLQSLFFVNGKIYVYNQTDAILEIYDYEIIE
ncbi:MAG: 6-bladed beta-propeller [Candidatus Delongbacteria bacterium]|nr:6-bladed beta-propeller [Candidatus Delongbacteria bacterium]